MPYKHETDRLKLPRHLDRRIKYTDKDKQDVIKLYASGISQRAIARKTGMSRRYVSFILFPDRMEKCKEQFKERRLDRRYYDRETNTCAIRSSRRYKQKHFNELIKL